MLKVQDLQHSIDFYQTLFDAAPTVRKAGYAKWMLDDPRVNFSIAQHAAEAGIEHLGIQAEDEAELQDLYGRLERAEATVTHEGETVCCYAQSEKSWIEDPQGVSWEVFYTYGESDTYYAPGAQAPAACCADTCCEASAG